jgi:hypothetical protein
MNARVNPSNLSPDELQQDADRMRRQIGSTVERLRTRLTPRNIVSEIAEGAGMQDVTPRSVVDFAARRHPISTVLVGLGLGVLAFSVLKSSATPDFFLAGAIRAKFVQRSRRGQTRGLRPRGRGAFDRRRGAA